jgi:hypothetical protein
MIAGEPPYVYELMLAPILTAGVKRPLNVGLCQPFTRLAMLMEPRPVASSQPDPLAYVE